MTKMHQCCCAQMAPSGGLDGNRYRLMEIEGSKEKGPCGVTTKRRGRCQAEEGLSVAVTSTAGQCPYDLEYDVKIQEGKLGLCATHFRYHVAGEWLWVYLPPL